MDAFHILSRGGEFNKNKYKKDVARFSSEKAAPVASTSSNLPPEIDFFKYTKRNLQEREGQTHAQALSDDKTVESPLKRRKLEQDPQPSSKQPERIVAKGSNVPEKAESFAAMQKHYGIPSRLISNLNTYGYHTPTGIQSQGCPIMLERRDLVAISPTGTGKTLSYLLPLFALLRTPLAAGDHQYDEDIARGLRALIIAPTNELAHQIHNECLKLAHGRKWRVVLFSKATASTLATKEVRQKTDIIVGTPLRLVTALQSGNLELSYVQHLIMDEADRLLDKEFYEQTSELIAACTHPNVQKAVFSATIPSGVEKMVMALLRNPIRVVIGLKDTPLPLIEQSLTYVQSDESKLPTLVDYLSTSFDPPLIVFCSTQDRASSLTEQLLLRQITKLGSLHGGMTKAQREDAVHRMLAGDTWVLVTTEVAARGLDFKGVREVINYDFPTSVQSYIHRIGRTGRAGQTGRGITYFTDNDAPYLKPIANVLAQSGSTVPEWILKLPKPSKLKRRNMGKAPRPKTVNFDAHIGKGHAIRQRDMVSASKRKARRPGVVGENEE